VSTPEVERLIGVVRNTPGVYGARLMGGGFGGNVLALTVTENVETLIAHTQAEYYGPRNRHGVEEGSVMISTPGDGLRQLDLEDVWRDAVREFNLFHRGEKNYRQSINDLLDAIPLNQVENMVWPVIVAAGKGSRSVASGLSTPKPLAPVLATPSIIHVIRN